LLAAGPLAREVIAARAGLEPGPLARALLELELAERIVLDRDGRLRLRWC
jgi:predicted Rossmann fold nucleotide-binding protein DprA/Smf involved in DNA uptake